MATYDTDRRRPRLAYFDLFDSARELIRGKYWLFFGIAAVGHLIAGLVPFAICLGPMTCGIFFTLRRHQDHEPVEFVDLFRGFDWFPPSLLVALAKIGVSLALVIPVMVIMFLMMFGIGASEMSPDAEMTALLSAMGAFYLILIVPLLFVEMIFLYTFPLIIDRGMGAGEAMGASWRACWRHPWGTTKIVVLNALLWMLGSLCCVVPFFLVLPVTYGVIWLGYREIFGPPPAPCPSERQPSCQTKSS